MRKTVRDIERKARCPVFHRKTPSSFFRAFVFGMSSDVLTTCHTSQNDSLVRVRPLRRVLFQIVLSQVHKHRQALLSDEDALKLEANSPRAARSPVSGATSAPAAPPGCVRLTVSVEVRRCIESQSATRRTLPCAHSATARAVTLRPSVRAPPPSRVATSTVTAHSASVPYPFPGVRSRGCSCGHRPRVADCEQSPAQFCEVFPTGRSGHAKRELCTRGAESQRRKSRGSDWRWRGSGVVVCSDSGSTSNLLGRCSSGGAGAGRAGVAASLLPLWCRPAIVGAARRGPAATAASRTTAPSA